jgi:hypothetical protein
LNAEEGAAGEPLFQYGGSKTGQLDVAGVRLGIKPDEVVRALKTFDVGLYFGMYYVSPKHTYAKKEGSGGIGKSDNFFWRYDQNLRWMSRESAERE